MDREIKFRAYTEISNEVLGMKYDVSHDYNDTVMQFTGLSDRNGVEIYEGDIVVENSYPMFKDGLCNYRCAVVWCESSAGFELEMYCVSNRVHGCSSPNSICEYNELEVVGNIRQHAHLLEHKE